MLRHLQRQGHEVRVVGYDRSYAALKEEFDCLEIEGLHIVSRDNKVSALGTITHNLRRARRAIARNRALVQLFDPFNPDVVITDFEPATAWLANWRKIPLVSLDNQHRLRYMKFSVPAGLLLDKWLTRLIIALMIPRPTVSLATSLVLGERTNPHTRIFPPIVRQEVLALNPQEQDFHLVYVTSAFASLIAALKAFPDRTFHVYGHHDDAQDQNIHYRRFSGDAFLHDLAACHSVIATAGFTLMSEAMCLGKPYLALPMTGQFEQQVNALFLERSGCGINARRASVEVLQSFFARQAEFKRGLQEYNASLLANGFPRYGGSAIKNTLDALLANNLVLPPAETCNGAPGHETPGNQVTPNAVPSPVRGSDELCDTAR